MSQEGRKAEHGVIIRADSGALIVGETVTPGFDLTGHRKAVIHIRQLANLVTPDVDDHVRFFIDTAYGDPVGGNNPRWVAVANVTYDDGDDGNAPEAVSTIGEQNVNNSEDDLEVEIADDANRNLPLGDRIRIRTTVAGATAPTYRYEAFASFLGG